MTEHNLKLSTRLVRETIWARQGGACARCWTGMHIDSMHAHHRQRRRDLGWCPCNVVGLHSDCHVIAPQAVHQQPAAARASGLIVATWDDPRTTPLWVEYPWRLWSLLVCDGTISSCDPQPARCPVDSSRS